MRTYKVIGEGINQILEMTETDGTIRFVPMDEANSDYQRYLNPEAEQSTPSVIDEAEAK
jgi:hypothetical protein